MGHTYCNLLYHLVFSTKERIPLLREPFQGRMQEYLGGAINGEGGIILAVGGTDEHAHLLARLRQDKAVADVLRNIKSNSSRWAHRETGLGGFAWQEGYGAFTVSQSQVGRVRRYIRGQEKHHGRQSFQDEFRALLNAHEIEYDERYIWD